MNEIKQITVVSNVGVSVTKVGENGIVKIVSNSIEYPDNLIRIYSCYDKHNKVVKSIEQCPCEVEYFPTPEVTC